MTFDIVSFFLNNALMCLITEMMFAVYSLWAFTAPDLGGLGISEAEIGTHLGVRAVIYIGTLVMYPRLLARMGPLRMYQAGVFMIPVTILMYPTLNWLVRSGYHTTGWPFLIVWFFFMFLWTLSGTTWSRSIKASTLSAAKVDGRCFSFDVWTGHGHLPLG